MNLVHWDELSVGCAIFLLLGLFPIKWATVDSKSWLVFLYKTGWLLGSLCSLLCRKESLENKKNNKPEVNQIANSDNKV